MTIKNFHTEHGLDINPASIKKRLYREGMAYGVNDELNAEAIATLEAWYLGENKDQAPELTNGQLKKSEAIKQLENEHTDLRVRFKDIPKQDTSELQQQLIELKQELTRLKEKPEPKEVPAVNFTEPEAWWFIFWRRIAPNAPLPLLALPASFGVFFFAKHFIPTWAAVTEAAAFEFTYIGLTALEGLTEEQRKRAQWVAMAAVAVSVLYNTIAAALHQQPSILNDLPLYWLWIVSLVHGAPLAILAYLVSDLLFHRNK